jgi:hypothetical protein
VAGFVFVTLEAEVQAETGEDAQYAVYDWLADTLPEIRPDGVDAKVSTVKVGNGKLRNGLWPVEGSVDLRDGTKPRDPAPEWLVSGLQTNRRPEIAKIEFSVAGAIMGGPNLV